VTSQNGTLPPEVQNLRLTEIKSTEVDWQNTSAVNRVRFSGLEQSSRRLEPTAGGTLAILIILLLLMFWLGARGLNADAIWSDERTSILDAGGWPYDPRTPADVWNGVAGRNPWHAPGYFILLNGWGALVGWQPPALRALSLLAGCIAVAATYRLGRDLLTPRVGLYAAALMATSAFFINFLHELRMYTLFVALVALTLWLYWRVIRNNVHVGARRVTEGNAKPLPLKLTSLTFSAAAMLYIHYFALLPLAAVALYHLLFVKKDRCWWQVTGALVIAGMVFLPWVTSLFTGVRLASETEWLRGLPEMDTLTTLNRLTYIFTNGFVPLLILLIAAFWLNARGARFIRFVAWVTLALILLINLPLQIMIAGRLRYLLTLWPMLAVLAAAGILMLGRYWKPAAPIILTGWIALGLWNTLTPEFIRGLQLDSGGYVFPWQQVIDDLKTEIQPGDSIIVHLPQGVVSDVMSKNQLLGQYYVDRTNTFLRVVETLYGTEGQQAQSHQETMDFANQSQRVWSLYEDQNQAVALGQFQSAIVQDYALCPLPAAQTSVQMDLYARSSVCCPPDMDAAPLMRFGGIHLTGMHPLPEKVSGAFPVLLGWSQAPDVPRNTYSVALHILDSDDNLVAQADYGLAESAFQCHEALVDMSALTPGSYRVYGIVYAWESGTRLSGEVVETGETGERLLLGQFRVTSNE
jgi:uncharacterized membrane protein